MGSSVHGFALPVPVRLAIILSCYLTVVILNVIKSP